MTTAVDNQPVSARLVGGRCDGLVTHSSYTTPWGTTRKMKMSPENGLLRRAC